MNTLRERPTIKGFDAIKESRKWKEASRRELAGMTFEEMQAHLQKVHEKLYTDRRKPQRKRTALAVH